MLALNRIFFHTYFKNLHINPYLEMSQWGFAELWFSVMPYDIDVVLHMLAGVQCGTKLCWSARGTIFSTNGGREDPEEEPEG